MSSFVRGYDARHLIGRSMTPAAPPSSLIPPTTSSCTTRIMSPPAPIPTYTPAVTPPVRGPASNPESSSGTAVSNTSPVGAGSPLTRLQGMQPFDYRREHLSPAVSPGTGSEKSLTLSSSGNKTPEDLSMGGASAASSPPSSSNPIALTTQVNPMTQITPSKADSSDEISSYTSGHMSDDGQEGVINYSTKGLANSSVYADRKVKHLRKSANPMKRHWQPNPQFGSTLISPSGKKRVLCTACNKTFCDKGALKIHYSAVHLKEMHKCTVEGCNMMFSSRRSRNRHSANPNPKLHMPNQKRKLPDGATLVDDKGHPLSLATSVCTNPTITMAAPSDISPGLPNEIKPLVPKQEPGVGHDQPPLTPAEMGFYMDPTTRMPLLIPSPVKVPKLDLSPPGTSAPTAHMMPMEGFLHSNTPIKIEPSAGHRSSRKRKSAVPTRCAQQEEVYVMSDDDNGTGVTEAATEENLMPQNLTVPKKRCSVESDERLDEKDPCTDNDSCKEDSIGECTSGHCNSDDERRTTNDHLMERSKGYEGLSLTAFHDIQAKAIRQMDSISQARIRDVCNDNHQKDNDSNNNDEEAEDEAEMVDSRGPSSNSTRNGKHSASNMNTDSNRNGDSAPPSPLSPSNNMSDMESSSSSVESSPTHTNGHNGKDIDMGDIPLDKDNPRMCAACGKLFPNPFGLKTHYQNVHLKLMHTCSIEGCNAAFPSKRSRDRHSSNLNLHRKLLSTSSSDGEGKTKGLVSRDDYMPRIYDGYTGPNTYTGGHQYENEDGEDCNDLVVNMSTRTDANMNNSVSDGYTGSSSPQNLANGESPSHHDGGEEFTEADSQDDSPATNHDGSVTCHICRQHFRDNLVLKEHYEKTHPKEMYRCTIGGCDKIFSTRKSRNRHSQNDNLHRHLSPSTNGTPWDAKW